MNSLSMIFFVNRGAVQAAVMNLFMMPLLPVVFLVVAWISALT